MKTPDKARISLLLHAGGLIFVYSLYGVLQEKIMKSSTYGPNDEHFTSSSLLIVANRVFSVCVGMSILFFKSRQTPERGSFSQQLRPASAFTAYASVAAFNFLSTTCQYEALKYVSYTTQSLAKTSKMIPVLVVGALVWKKQHRAREWVAGGVILFGCATYLFSQPPSPSHAPAETNDDGSLLRGLVGALFLIAYLFFDGLVSTTQEKVFGRNPSSSDPFGPESPVLDQMIWTNIFAGLIALGVALLSSTTGTLMPNLRLLFTSPALVWDICVFSAASALGLIILLNTIASFGALTCSLVMTIRQFLSILINAGIFGNFAKVSIEGWIGVGHVASGIWIKINKAYDPPKIELVSTRSAAELDAEVEELLEKEGLGGLDDSAVPFSKRSKAKIFVLQYAVPIMVPIILAILIAPFTLPSGALQSNGIVSKTTTWANTVAGWNGQDDQAADDGVALSMIEAENDEQDDLSALNIVDNAEEGDGEGVEQTAQDEHDEALLNAAEANEASVAQAKTIQLLGGVWDEALHDAVAPTCRPIETVSYRPTLRTGFVSFPRSGNSYMRSMVERATGYRTSSVYCDKGLAQTFLDECDHENNFFVKTHFPALPRVIPPDEAQYYRRFDQALLLVRDPLDAIASWWHLQHAPRTSSGFRDHEAKVEIPGGKFGDLQRKALLEMAERWRRHSLYWLRAPILTHLVRYEDLRASPVPHMMSAINFLLPDQELPSLNDLACLAEVDESHEAYHSRKVSAFHAWDQFEDDLRLEILLHVRRPFCEFGYFERLEKVLGPQRDLHQFCERLTIDGEMNIALTGQPKMEKIQRRSPHKRGGH